ncbi:hypothetical protein EUX98_g2980 [Antrodiella citrinella]|uniref:Uncharacterized protein n=1 Tax=Antrodiella citrinella TaxID=2447956 RepID=A0A4V3XJ07_9APHY|nr:hypothetical protein EUX98_g2980 [Antrodiella citrinella]
MALAWVLKTTTDPVVLADTAQLMYDVEPDDLISWDIVENLLRALFGHCQFIAKDKLELSSVVRNRAVGICSGFIFCSREKLAGDHKGFERWIRTAGTKLLEEHTSELDHLSEAPVNSANSEENDDHDLLISYDRPLRTCDSSQAGWT